MCGIAGKVSAEGPADRDAVEAMCSLLEHRGPDSRGIHVAGGAALGMTRLAVIDLVTGDQPLLSEDGTVALVLNGEIYNHRELRRELEARGHRFASRSDAEVALHLYEDEGPGAVRRLHGMFAFAIWDRARRRLLLGRDRLGKKPLHYVASPQGVTFSSEIRSLLADRSIPRALDPLAIDAYLANQYVPGDRCAFAAVEKLPPAAILEWTPGREARVERYWHLDYEPKHALDRAEAAERVRELLLDSVARRLESDVPLGAFLSGGIDSSAVVAAMTRLVPGRVKTFTVAFPDPEFDEREHARRVANHLGTDHYELEVGPVDAGLLARIAGSFGEPLADPAAVPAYQLAELTRRHVTVCLGGDGGDETFAGYRRYWQIDHTLVADRVPIALRRAFARGMRGAAGGVTGPGTTRRAARLANRLAMAPAQRFSDLARWFSDEDRHRLYGPALQPALAADPLAAVHQAWGARPGLGGPDRAMATDIATYLPDDLLVKADMTSMAHSLELRSPLLDHRLVEFAAGLPASLKLRGREGKGVLRDAVSGWLPGEIRERRKHGFAVPVGSWLRGPLRPLAEDLLLSRRAEERGFFQPAAVRGLLAEHQAGHDRAQQLWAMLILELWCRASVDSAPVAEMAFAPA